MGKLIPLYQKPVILPIEDSQACIVAAQDFRKSEGKLPLHEADVRQYCDKPINVIIK